jgi:acetyl esterase/lipase
MGSAATPPTSAGKPQPGGEASPVATSSYSDEDPTRGTDIMTSERTQAYGRVVRTLDDLGPTKLQPAEQERIRDAADTLIFAASPEEVRPALEDVRELAEHLAASGRWSDERAEALLRDVEACGPVTAVS